MEREGRTGFDRELEEARQRAGLDKAPVRGPVDPGEQHPLAIAVRIGAEMAATLAVACALGYGLDRLFGTKPWLMVLFMPIGIAAGARNVMRIASPGKSARGMDEGTKD